jgi:hypothetical protein
MGPGLCPLCKQNKETVKHLFIHCTFAFDVWNMVLKDLSLVRSWLGNTIHECFTSWTTTNPSAASLPTFLNWHIWNERNHTLFEEGTPSAQKVVFKTISALKLHGSRIKSTFTRPQKMVVPVDKAVAWFDGAAQQKEGICGAGGKIVINNSTSYSWTFNCGKGSNTKAELLGAWASLILASRLSLQDLLMLGDSRIVIDWLNKRGAIQVAALESWKD